MRWILIPFSMALLSCGAEDVTVVERADLPPQPERLLYNDIEENEIFGASCAFAPAGGGSGAIAIAMIDGGYIKMEGELLQLMPVGDEPTLGPPEMKFFGNDYAFGLVLDPESERPHGDGGREFDATITVTASDGTQIYNSQGLVQCGA